MLLCLTNSASRLSLPQGGAADNALPSHAHVSTTPLTHHHHVCSRSCDPNRHFVPYTLDSPSPSPHAWASGTREAAQRVESQREGLQHNRPIDNWLHPTRPSWGSRHRHVQPLLEVPTSQPSVSQSVHLRALLNPVFLHNPHTSENNASAVAVGCRLDVACSCSTTGVQCSHCGVCCWQTPFHESHVNMHGPGGGPNVWSLFYITVVAE